MIQGDIYIDQPQALEQELKYQIHNYYTWYK